MLDGLALDRDGHYAGGRSRLWNKAVELEESMSLTCLAIDEPEPYCLDDGGKNEKDEVSSSVIRSRGAALYTKFRVCVLHTRINF